jgi:transcriptional regulator with XRE-family HTH domain
MGQKKSRPDSQARAAFAARLKAARLSHGNYPNNIDLARAIGVEGETYNRWERGETEPGIANLAKLHAALGISLDWLVAGDRRGLPFEEQPSAPSRAASQI